jgi:hypothetical protein
MGIPRNGVEEETKGGKTSQEMRKTKNEIENKEREKRRTNRREE